jgi:beta-glucosidase/6-phospho-beta-glucosidase/beta-galactosidase
MTAMFSPFPEKSPFRSFWMGGFECADHLNAFGNRVDFLTITQHLERIDEDYENLATLRIRTVREGIRWSQVEKTPYVYDWKAVAHMMERARVHGIQQVWDICHFGFAEDLTPLHPLFPRRFAALCRAFVRFFRSVDRESTLIVTPINEVSFLSWYGGDIRATSPYCTKQGWEVKYQLMKAYIEGIEAMKEEDAGVRILTTEPLINVTHAPDATPRQKKAARDHHQSQFQVTDILGGQLCPELRGRPEYLDVLGINYYYDNQWVQATGERLSWQRTRMDARWIQPSRLIEEVYKRYRRPLVLAETSHPGVDRPLWIRTITNECRLALEAGVPLWGICWYPLIDRPDWDHLHRWHQSGLWDREVLPDGTVVRRLHEPTVREFIKAQQTVGMPRG